MEFNEKRPEGRVLEKSDHQVITCPACRKVITVSNNRTSATCECGQAINWGLRK